MFEKKMIIYSENFGVCRVSDVTKLTEKSGQNLSYYVLNSIYDKKKVSYIPVENHKVMLRELISEEEARRELDDLVEADALEETSNLVLGEIAYVLGMSMDELLPPAVEKQAY